MTWDKIESHLIDFSFKLVFAILILVVGLKLVKFVMTRVRRGRLAQRMDDSLKGFVLSFFSISLKIIVVVSAALVLGIPEASFATLLASAGVAIGLALQGSLANFAGGLLILLFKPFKAGDFIETQNLPTGWVEEISICYTKLRTPNNDIIVLPNGSLTNSSIINYSAQNTRRLRTPVSVSYNSDLDKVRQILIDCAKQEKSVLDDPGPSVAVVKQNESSVDLELRTWCKTKDYLDLELIMNELVKKALDANGIQIPYPQLDLHVIEPENKPD